jgi:hypothetical protein
MMVQDQKEPRSGLFLEPINVLGEVVLGGKRGHTKLAKHALTVILVRFWRLGHVYVMYFEFL